ncbi:thioredoxin family protein [Pusillimonas sp. SM2304]|uniref:thioredoxin family protein n=1 Tax=Pusillimonas sp. SM2304 TaxID=3073241 RepID=UPI0028766CD7|nr:thioredoxin family protein [Pusillimonas sp. SM2304]MDS1140734.1 thioredoxin family protein [Pusillimonas sp. SM2304]
MPVFEPQYDTPALAAQLGRHDGLTIACYCAAWCDTCTEYRPHFNALAEKWPECTFVWVDIEENPELLGDEDVENFPTLLIQGRQGNLFFGTLLPHIAHLDRLIERADQRSPVLAQGPGPLLTLLDNA